MDRFLGIATNPGHQRTPKVTLEADGMQGVRGSNPLSSTEKGQVSELAYGRRLGDPEAGSDS
jgi:hypothetical protein